jgi:hypothetical protein
LKAPAICVHNSDELAQPHDPLARQIAHVSDSLEGRHMMLAHASERDAMLNDQLVVSVASILECLEQPVRADPITPAPLSICLCNAGWGLIESFPVWVGVKLVKDPTKQ